ncbi:hypothetical protein AC094_25490 [Bacteroides fragilis]|uniref:Uncharacterized protein n=1 Tax=Bacteroides fragilis TaxID=817 RepID=A0A853PVV6_BACFG|nr:hypothetical protein M075_2787 [Bacteroides fragilis str. 20793-3]OCR31777.1 hypothetical protein AC094_25490 [Bacteroides fragilis]
MLGKLCTAEQCLPGMIITPKFTGEAVANRNQQHNSLEAYSC